MSDPKTMEEMLALLSDESVSLMPEDVVRLRSKANPYMHKIDGPEQVVTLSYTDLDEKFKMRLLTTTMIGFLHRACAEWRVPAGQQVIPPLEYLQECIKEKTTKPSKYEPTDEEHKRESPKFRAEREENMRILQERIIIQRFLEDQFQFDPDEHVRSAYTPDLRNKNREMFKTPAAELAIKTRCRKNPEFRASYEEYQRLDGKIAPATTPKAVESKELAEPVGPDEPEASFIKDYMSAAAPLKDKIAHIADIKGDRTADAKREVDPLVGVRTREMIPPADVFHRIYYYMHANYEALLSAVKDLYCEVPVFEAAIYAYRVHKNVDEADDFIDKYSDDFKAQIYKIQTGGWVITSPYERVRSSTRYFNKNTYVLEEIIKQRVADEKLGQELMEKKVKKLKKKNIEEDGPDAPGFVQWKKNNQHLKSMGVRDIKEEDDCPEDALEVKVFTVKEGGRKLGIGKFYTESAPPDRPEPARTVGGARKSLRREGKKHPPRGDQIPPPPAPPAPRPKLGAAVPTTTPTTATSAPPQ